MQLGGRHRCRWWPKYNNVMVGGVSEDIVDGISCVWRQREKSRRTPFFQLRTRTTMVASVESNEDTIQVVMSIQLMNSKKDACRNVIVVVCVCVCCVCLCVLLVMAMGEGVKNS